MKIGDLVWCQNGNNKNMGLILGRDPNYPIPDTKKPLGLEDYVWVILTEGSPGQEKWTKVKKLELICESG
jgi:hypothetical protein|tara:strand:+ start:2905 stop:3114 length:210 start_codon:yes stop_codon:yes gene_type:complete